MHVACHAPHGFQILVECPQLVRRRQRSIMYMILVSLLMPPRVCRVMIDGSGTDENGIEEKCKVDDGEHKVFVW
jgi:hypothetical protein